MSDPYIGEIRMVAFTYAPYGWPLCNGQLLQISQNQALFALIGKMYGGDGVNTFGVPNFQGRVPIHAGQGAQPIPPYTLAQFGGVPSMALTVVELPPHQHNPVITDPSHAHTVSIPAHTHSFAVPCDTSGTPNSATPAGSYPSSTSMVDYNFDQINTALSGSGGSATLKQPTGLYSSSGGGSMAPGTTGQASGTAGSSGSALTGVKVTENIVGMGQPFSIEPPFLVVNFVIALMGIYPPRC